jgi:hypothetical protein
MSRIVTGIWDVDGEFFVHVVAVSLVQLIALELLPAVVFRQDRNDLGGSGGRQ